ncbi:MAG: hypothetical protein RL757_219 [Bacteroidota bacterium]|jgi:hypothetical protein
MSKRQTAQRPQKKVGGRPSSTNSEQLRSKKQKDKTFAGAYPKRVYTTQFFSIKKQFCEKKGQQKITLFFHQR